MDKKGSFVRAFVYVVGYPVMELLISLSSLREIRFSFQRFIAWAIVVIIGCVLDWYILLRKEKDTWEKHKAKLHSAASKKSSMETEHQKQMEYARAVQEEIDRRQQAALEEAFMREQQTRKTSEGANGTDEEGNADTP